MTSPQAVPIAVITGAHPFDVPNFYRLFRELEGADAYVQHMENFASSRPPVRDAYDAVVFYGMPKPTPSDEGSPWFEGRPKAAIERLPEGGQGIVVLHHAILAYPDWGFWDALVGIGDRSFEYEPGLDLAVTVADAGHPVTAGASDFSIVDEAYKMQDTEADSHVLLSVDHEKSMKHVAWARTCGKSRVFCLALGHDNNAWSSAGFRHVLGRGISWAAGRV